MLKLIKLTIIFSLLFIFICSVNNARAELFMTISGKVIETDTGAGLQGINIVLMSQTNGKVMKVK